MTCLSLALNLPPEVGLDQSHTRSAFDFDLIHYPALPEQLLCSGAVTRVPAHSDFGTVTLLFQDEVGGLEIADPRLGNPETSAEAEKRGTFQQVPPRHGTVLINVGYLLMRWTNGQWRNAIHRVSKPPCPTKNPALGESDQQSALQGSGIEVVPERHSIALFVEPDPEAIVEALPGCWNEDVPKIWKPIPVGDYLQKKKSSTQV